VDEFEDDVCGMFVSFILMDCVAVNIDKFLNDLREDWDIEIDEEKIVRKDDGIVIGLDSDGNEVWADKTIELEIEGTAIALSFFSFPVPDGEAVNAARTSFSWDDAVKIAENHKSFISVAAYPKKSSLLKSAVTYVKSCASCLKQRGAVGINTIGTVFSPETYIKMAQKHIIDTKSFPLMNLVYIGIYSVDEGKTFGGYTIGMGILGRKNIEVLNSKHSGKEVFELMYGIISYILNNDVVLKDGETIGFLIGQKLAVTESSGFYVEENTFKIDY